jgi:hypothetical protein
MFDLTAMQANMTARYSPFLDMGGRFFTHNGIATAWFSQQRTS